MASKKSKSSQEYIDKLTKTMDAFNATLLNYVNLIEKYADKKDMDVDRVKKLLKILYDESPLECLQRSAQKLVDNAEQIIKCDEKYFLNDMDYEKYIKNNSNYDVMQRNIIKKMKDKFHGLSRGEKNEIWKITNVLLQHAMEYQMLQNDYY